MIRFWKVSDLVGRLRLNLGGAGPREWMGLISRRRRELLAIARRHVQCARSAHGVFEQFERHRVAGPQIIEDRSFLKIRTVEEDIAFVVEPNKTVPLSDEQLGHPARRTRAAEVTRTGSRTRLCG